MTAVDLVLVVSLFAVILAVLGLLVDHEERRRERVSRRAHARPGRRS